MKRKAKRVLPAQDQETAAEASGGAGPVRAISDADRLRREIRMLRAENKDLLTELTRTRLMFRQAIALVDQATQAWDASAKNE